MVIAIVIVIIIMYYTHIHTCKKHNKAFKQSDVKCNLIERL